MKMNETTRSRLMRLLTEAKERVWQCSIGDIPVKFRNRAETIDRKLVDLIEDLRDVVTDCI